MDALGDGNCASIQVGNDHVQLQTHAHTHMINICASGSADKKWNRSWLDQVEDKQQQSGLWAAARYMTQSIKPKSAQSHISDTQPLLLQQ